MRKLKLFFACLLMAVLSIGQMWATTYKLTKVTSVEAGKLYVFERNSHVFNNTSSSSALQTTATYNTSGLEGTESYVWTLESATGGFYLKNVSLASNQYLNNASKTTVSFGAASSIWTIAFTGEVALISNTSNSNRFLGDAGKDSPNNTYKAYATSNLNDYQHDITVYVLDEEGSTPPTPAKTLVSVAVSGAPTKTSYYAGDNFDPAGLTVTGTYSDESTAPITSGITWSYNPSQTLAANQTSIGVTATVGEISSDEVNVTVTVTVPTVSNWQVIAPENLATGDVVVLTMNVDGTYYAASNNNGTSNPPSATSLAVTGSNLSATPATTLQWTVTVVSEGVFQFAIGDKKLYCTDTNNGVRVGTDPSTTFCNTFDIHTATDNDNKLYLHATTLTRYLGVYNNANWRCYGSVNTNIKNGSLVIFKENDNREAAGLEFATKQYLIKKNTSFSAPELTNQHGLTVTYTSSNEAVAEVAANGAITIKADATGAATITASFAGDETYKDGSASYTIYVAEQAGTAEDPLTEASAKDLIDLGCTMSAHVTGTIQGKTYYSNSGSYNVTLTNGFLFYYFYAAANSTPFESDILTNGDELVGYGQLMKYGNNYEINPSYMVSRVPYSEPLVDISNTLETAYTPAYAIQLYNDPTSDLTKEVYVKGVVVASPAIKYNSGLTDAAEVYNGTYNVYVKAEDDNSENPTKFEFFRMYADDNNTTFEDGDIQVGELIVAKGTLSKYNSTYEFAQGCQMVSKKSKATMTFDDLEMVVNDEETLAPKTITLATAEAVTYAIKEGSDDCITLANGVVNATAEGTATIVATVATVEAYIGTSVEFTVTVSAAVDTRKVANSPAEFTTTNGNLDPADIAYASYQGGSSTAPAIYNDGIRLYQISGTNDFGGFITLTAKAGCTIDEVQITTTSKYATTVAYSVDGNENLLKSESVAASSSYTTGTGLNVSSVNILNVGTGSSGRLEIASIKVYYTGEALTIDHYELGGTYQTAFMQDEEFNHTGLIVYAVYDALGENKVDITSMCTFSEPDMSTTGEKTIEITYNEAVVKTYTINVAADSRKVANSPATFTTVSGDMTPNDITFASNQGGAGTAPQNYNDGIRLYQAPSGDAIGGFITLKAKKGCTIDQVKITTTNTYATTVAYSIDGNENLLGSESVAKSSDYSTPSGLNVESVNIVNKGTGSSGRLEIASIKVWYTGNPLPVDHYFLDGTYETTFEQNGTFDYTGLEVYASYDAGETITEPVEGFTVEADLSTAGEKKAEVYLNEVKIAEYDITVTAGKEDPALAYTPASATITAGDAWSAPTLNNTFSVSPITYSSDKESVATVDENGVITLAGGYGTAVITAHFDETAAYIESEATYTITVNKPAPTPTSTVYRKVTATADITDGEYLIVYEGDATHDAVVFDGSLDNENIDVAKKVLAVEIENDEIAGNTELDAAVFTIDVTAGTLQSASGLYIGRTANSNGMDKSTTEAYVNTFAITDGAAVITTAEGPTLRYNYASDQLRFRYYKSGQQAIQLYKKVVVEPEWETVRGDLKPNHYYTVCLPKKMMEVRGASFWTLSSRNEAGSMAYLEEVDPTIAEAGTPFIIQATDTKLEVVYTGAATTTAGTNGALHGTLGDMDYDDLYAAGNVYLLIKNAIRPLASGNYLNANRAYIDYYALNPVTEAPQPAPGRRVRAVPMQQNTATGIDELNGSEAPAKVLINGQLFILRGEKMYDVKGQMVK